MWRTLLLSSCSLLIAGAAVAARVRLTDGPVAADRGVIPRRIVSLVPAVTETLCRLGLADRLVGRSRYCDWPPDVRRVPDVGGLLDPNVERIARIRPDLLIVPTSGKDLRGLLDAAGLPYLALPNDSLDDVFASIGILGERCDCRPAADALIAELSARIDRARRRAPGLAPLRVLLSISPARERMPAPWVAGPNGYLGALVRLAGHRLVPEALGPPYGTISLETLLATNPDVIIECRGLAGEPADLPPDPHAAWAALGSTRAVQERRVFVLDGAAHVIPGPRFVDTLDRLVELLTPPARESGAAPPRSSVPSGTTGRP